MIFYDFPPQALKKSCPFIFKNYILNVKVSMNDFNLIKTYLLFFFWVNSMDINCIIGSKIMQVLPNRVFSK